MRQVLCELHCSLLYKFVDWVTLFILTASMTSVAWSHKAGFSDSWWLPADRLATHVLSMLFSWPTAFERWQHIADAASFNVRGCDKGSNSSALL